MIELTDAHGWQDRGRRVMQSRKWQDRSRRALSAAVVVICYLVVFAGILFSFAGR